MALQREKRITEEIKENGPMTEKEYQEYKKVLDKYKK